MDDGTFKARQRKTGHMLVGTYAGLPALTRVPFEIVTFRQGWAGVVESLLAKRQ